MVRIGFGMRLAAALIDCCIMAAVMVAMNATIVMLMGVSVAGMMVAVLLSGIAGLAYSSLEVLRAASLGKLILKYQITMADGSAAPRDVLIKRWAIKQAPMLLYLLGAVTIMSLFSWMGVFAGMALLVGCFLALQPEKLAWHDKLLGTAVHGSTTISVGFPVLTPAPVRAPAVASRNS